jgi:hypothetical protein
LWSGTFPAFLTGEITQVGLLVGILNGFQP